MKYLYIILVMLVSISVFSQKQENEKDKLKSEKKEARKAKRAKKIKDGKFIISPVAAPGFTPELGGLIAVGGLTSFKTNPNDSLIQRSSMPFTIAYTTTNAIVAQALLTSYWFKDKLRVNVDLWYKDMPDQYWGIGYDAAYNNYKSDTTTAYNRLWWWINPRFLYQFKSNYFIGLNIDYNYTQGSDASAPVASDSIFNSFKDKPMNSGLGLILRYDSRDIPVDAWSGMLIDLRGTFYATELGGDNNYQVYQLDYRQFETIGRKGQVLGWQLKTRIAEGDVHYGEMSQLGTPFDLRGYMWGRYRNNNMLYFLAEYRYTIMKSTGELSKHGFVTWVGSGTVFNFQTIHDNNNRWLPNFGVGYRLELQPRMNLRLDFGIGRESSGFYFNFNQAF